MAGLATYKRTIPAGRRETIGARGVAIIVRDVVGEIEITARSSNVGDGGGQAYSNIMRKFEKWFLPQEFDSVEVYNGGDESVAVELLIGYGDFVREVTSRSQAAKFIRGGRLRIAEPSPNTTTYHELLPENLARKRVMVQRLDSTGDLYAEVVHREPDAVSSIEWTGSGAVGVDKVDIVGIDPAEVAQPIGPPPSQFELAVVTISEGSGSELCNVDLGFFGPTSEIDGQQIDAGSVYADTVGDVEVYINETLAFTMTPADLSEVVPQSDFKVAKYTDLPRSYLDFDLQDVRIVLKFAPDHAYGPEVGYSVLPVEATAPVYIKVEAGESAAGPLVVHYLEEEFDA